MKIKTPIPTPKERELKNKIISCLLASNYRLKTLKQVWKLVKGEFQQ